MFSRLIELKVENGERMRFEPDPRYVQIALQEECKVIVAFFAQDFPHLMQPVKEAARKIQVPTVGLEAAQGDGQMTGGSTSMNSNQRYSR